MPEETILNDDFLRELMNVGEVDLLVTSTYAALSFTLDVPEAETRACEQYLGVDLGIVNLAVDSDGEVAT